MWTVFLVAALALRTCESGSFYWEGKWPNGEIVYDWSTADPLPQKGRQRFLDAFTHLQEHTCLKFYNKISWEARSVPHYETTYLDLTHRAGCWAVMGQRLGQATQTNLGPRCLDGRANIHEVLHAAGMPHEQARFDRDRFVRVYYGNITSHKLANYRKSDLKYTAIYGPYDITSIMHYSADSFVKQRGNYAMEPTSDDPDLLSVFTLVTAKSNFPSHYDLATINTHYDCAIQCPPISCKHDGYVDKNCECKCVDVLGGPTCEEMDSTGHRNTPGCGGEYRVMSAGDTFTFSQPTLNKLSPCAWFFTSELGTKMKIVVHKLSLGVAKYDVFEVRHLRPGQRGVPLTAWSSDRTGLTSPAPTTRTAMTFGDYRLDPSITVTVTPPTQPTRQTRSKFDFSATVTVTTDSSMRHAYLNSDVEEDWSDLWYVWESSRPVYDKASAKSDYEAAGGWYSLVMTASSSGREWLQTKTMWDGSSPVCVDFEYFATSSIPLDIQTWRRDDQSTSTHDTIMDSSWMWTSHRSTVNESGWFAVRFSYGPGSFRRLDGDLYLDNVSMKECGFVPPPPPATLPPPKTSSEFNDDFEANFEATWLRERELNHAWRQRSGETPSDHTGPAGAFKGNYYAYLECSRNSYKTGTLTPLNAVFDGLSNLCITFQYHMLGNGMGTLEVYRRDFQTKATSLFWLKGGADVNPMWQKADFTIPADSTQTHVEVVFQGTCGGSFTSDIALDDVEIKSCESGGGASGSGASSRGGRGRGGIPAPTAPPGTETIILDFEDEHTWDSEITNQGTLNYPTDGYDYWGRHQGATRSHGTGPDWAHGGSYYVYMEASPPNKEFQTADLIVNRVMQTDEAADMDFWFSMYGRHMGELQVLATEHNGAGENILWQRSESYDGWLHHSMTSPAQSWPSQIMFRGILGSGYYSDIALDDVTITFRPAVSSDVPASPPSRVDYPPQRAHAPPDISGHLEDADMLLQSFEKDLHGFQVQDETPLLPEKKWTGLGAKQPLSPHSGETESVKTGPSKASAGEYYLLFEAAGLSARATASLVTVKSFDADEEKCVLFDYHMYGSETGTLEVLSRDLDGNETSHWRVSGQNVNAWQEANAVIPPQPEIYQIVIRVTNGRGSQGDIGIDNVLLAKGPCRRITVGKHCQSCTDDYASSTSCRGSHLDGRPYCSAYGFARDSLWNSVNCLILEGYKDGYVTYKKSCVLPSCSLGYNAETDTDDVARTLHFTTDCSDRGGFHCEICCPDHCDVSGAARFLPGTAAITVVALGLTLYYKLLLR